MWACCWPCHDLARRRLPAGPSLNFCGVDLPLESGYTAASGSEITGPAYQLSWIYLDFGVMKTYPPEYVRLAKKKHKGAEANPFSCTLLDGPPAQGTRLSYATETGGMAYQYIVCGVAKGQPVLLDLTLPTRPRKNRRPARRCATGYSAGTVAATGSVRFTETEEDTARSMAARPYPLLTFDRTSTMRV